jgi:hypothetical protein
MALWRKFPERSAARGWRHSHRDVSRMVIALRPRREHSFGGLPGKHPHAQGAVTYTRSFLPDFFDGKFTDEDLNEEGNSFAQHYFDLETGQYVQDYGETLGFSPDDLYYVPDSWETFDRLKPVLDRRYAEWKNTGAS